ncbi:MAG: prepilin-type N-terminal cleavage/methylation domain-containing protein [Aquificota bacterium]|nr:MAG: prepilin-type N-terminal cleavage/methylation domain-containing protein [Aquificota bacterium]
MKRGFTLLEVLLVVSLLGLLFGLLSFSYHSALRNAYGLNQDTQKEKEITLFLWGLQRKLLGASDLYLKKDAIYMLTTGGEYYEGLVKAVYVFKDGWLYYYEFPYPYGELTFYEEDRLVKLLKLKSLSFRAYTPQGYQEEFRGLPTRVEVSLEGKRFLFEVLSLHESPSIAHLRASMTLSISSKPMTKGIIKTITSPRGLKNTPFSLHL